MHGAPTCLKVDGIVPLPIRAAVTHRYPILAAALLLGVVLPSSRASENASALRLIDQAASSARVDPEIFGGYFADMRAIGGVALGAARRLDLETGEIHEIQQQQFAFELPGQIQQNLERQQTPSPKPIQ